MDSTPAVAIRVQMKNLTQRGEMPDGSLDNVRIYMYLRLPRLPLQLKKGRHTRIATKSNCEDQAEVLWNRWRPHRRCKQPRRLRVPAGLVRQLPSPELLC
jgi:hypothetical protein